MGLVSRFIAAEIAESEVSRQINHPQTHLEHLGNQGHGKLMGQ